MIPLLSPPVCPLITDAYGGWTSMYPAGAWSYRPGGVEVERWWVLEAVAAHGIGEELSSGGWRH